MTQKYFKGDTVEFLIPDKKGTYKGEIISQNGLFGVQKPFLFKIETEDKKQYDIGQGYIIKKIDNE